MIFGTSDKIKISDMKVIINDLEEENSKLKQQLKNLEQVLAEVNSNLTAAKPVLDFDLMRVFSIERHVNNNKPCTIVGFFEKEPVMSSDGEMIITKDVHKEWYLYCNNERHAELVEEFKQWKTKQNGN